MANAVPKKPATLPDDREIILEFRQVGHALRVAAVDTETSIEIVFQAPAAAAMADLAALARRKLAARLASCCGLASDRRLL